MIEGIEKRIILYGDSISSIYLAYLLKIKNPDLYITVINKTNTQKYFLSSLDSLKETNLFSLVNHKSIVVNNLKKINVVTKNKKQLSIDIKNTYLFDYIKLKQFLISSCLSQEVTFLFDYDIMAVDNRKITIENTKENIKKELSYFCLIFSDALKKEFFSESLKTIEYLRLIVDVRSTKDNIDINILDKNTIVHEQPINEFTKKILIFSKDKNKVQIFSSLYKNNDYKIIDQKTCYIKTIDVTHKNLNNIYFIGSCAGVINHTNIDDIYLSISNAEILAKLLTKKIKHKKDIKDYEKKILSLTKESIFTKKTIDFVFSKTSFELDTLFLKINNKGLINNINLSSPKKQINKIKLNPKYLLLLKDLLFR